MNIWLVVSRGLQYLGLMLVFGRPAFALWLQSRDREPPFEAWSRSRRAWLAIAALLITVITGWIMAGSMAGSLAPASVSPLAMTLLGQTAVGHAWLIRVVLLLLWLGFGLCPGLSDSLRLRALTVLGGAALVSLAWAGHAAMDEGWRGTLHLGADAAHLLAAGLWLGALWVLGCRAWRARVEAPDQWVPSLERAATGFAPLGTWIVLLLCASGLVNDLLILGPHLTAFVATAYGRLLALKLVLFAGMLLLAAGHRFGLLPRLRQQLLSGQRPTVLPPLRFSLSLEAAAAVLILALVAWLGTLDPGGG
ncbi:copper homeostasis membrane protein CopD [Frateuria aurantia]